MENASETNVYSEMSDLVRQAEEWAAKNSIVTPTRNISDDDRSKLRNIEHRILKKAASMLFEKTGIRTTREFNDRFGKKLETEAVRKIDDYNDFLTVSPMNRKEFHSILKTGWGVENVSPIKEDEFQAFLKSDKLVVPSPFSTSRRASMFSNMNPLSTIESDDSMISENKPPRHSAPPVTRQLFQTSATPRKNITTPVKRLTSMTSLKLETPKRTTGTPKLQVTPLAGEGPLENRASRLRRMKTEQNK